MVGNGGISKDAENKAPWAYFDPDFNARNAWHKYRYVAYDQLFVVTFEPGTIPPSEDGSGRTARGSSCVALRQ
jgi:hypothetical protein